MKYIYDSGPSEFPHSRDPSKFCLLHMNKAVNILQLLICEFIQCDDFAGVNICLFWLLL